MAAALQSVDFLERPGVPDIAGLLLVGAPSPHGHLVLAVRDVRDRGLLEGHLLAVALGEDDVLAELVARALQHRAALVPEVGVLRVAKTQDVLVVDAAVRLLQIVVVAVAAVDLRLLPAGTLASKHNRLRLLLYGFRRGLSQPLLVVLCIDFAVLIIAYNYKLI